MNHLNVYIDVPDEPPGALVPVELLQLESRRTVRFLARTGKATPIDVKDGPLYLQAILADGQVLSALADIKDAETVVLTSESAAPHVGEDFSMNEVLGIVSEGLYPSFEDPYRGAWARLWRPVKGSRSARLWPRPPSGGRGLEASWEVVAHKPHSVRIERSELRWGVAGASGWALQVGGEFIPQRCVLLPPGDDVTVTLAYTGRGVHGFGGGYTLTARSSNEQAEALLAYCAAGELTAAQSIADEYRVNEANPLGAIVRGYYLLRTRALDPTEDWPRHLANSHRQLPDAAAVRIGQILLAPKPAPGELRSRIDQAVCAGLPSYTDGLRWLYRAVALLTIDHGEEHLRATHEWLRQYADAAAWDAVLTSFRGDPVHPTVELLTGRVDDDGIVRLMPEGRDASHLVTESVTVQVPVHMAYDEWTQFEESPSFMEGVEAVTQLDDRHNRWVADVAGTRREFDIEITDQLPNERVAWRTTAGEVRHEGVVTFHRIDDSRTRVDLTIDIEPTGMTEEAVDTVGVLDQRTRGDLRRFKEFIENRHRETGPSEPPLA
ncbi:SRPBCC family protein [Streptomyces virginiae]|uniref:SRPBCC family protein n=1 Tax=Streptomyces virginiae TaxID=1961 RepID=UPI0036251A5A